MVRVLLVAFIIALHGMAQAQAQTLEESIETYDANVAAAKLKVSNRLQELVLAADKKNDSVTSGKLREWKGQFENKGVIYSEVTGNAIAVTNREYGAALKAAGDKLREAYLAEIKKKIDENDKEGADLLSAQLEDRRLPTKLSSLQLTAVPSNYLNHWAMQFRANKAANEAEKMNATFQIRAGLSNPSFVSLESLNWPNHFMDHAGFRVRLAEGQDSNVWKNHATWIKVKGLSDRDGVSFQPATHPSRYLRIRSNGEAWVDEYQDKIEFKREATFTIKPGISKLW